MLDNYNKSKKFGYLINNHLDKLGFPISFHHTLRNIARLINYEEIKVYILDDEQKKLLLNTRNQVYPRPLPHWSMFVEQNFNTESLDVFGLFISLNSANDETFLEFGSGKEILQDMNNPLKKIEENLKDFVTFCENKGIPKTKEGKLDFSNVGRDGIKSLFKEHEQTKWDNIKEDLPQLTEKELKAIERDIRENKYRIDYYFWGFDNKDQTTFVQHDSIKFDDEVCMFLDYANKISEYTKEKEYKIEEIDLDMDSIEGLSKNIKIFVCNFLDFINNPDVQIIPIQESKERNSKRQKRGKPPIPEYRLIRLKGELKRYVEEARQNRFFEYSHKFQVRGHFRRYWDKDRYRSLYQKYLDGKLKGHYMDKKYNVLMVWVLPYIKGKGLLLDQIYEVSADSSHN